MSSPLSQDGDDVLLRVLAKPRASKSQMKGIVEGELSIQLAAPPVDGAANEELVKFLARYLEVPKSRIVLERGEASRHKVVRIRKGNIAELSLRLGIDG